VADIEFDDVSKVYPDGTRAVDGLDLHIHDGEFMVFVGPSGCGKTTALRMVAGLEEISAGTIRIGDRIVNELSPKARDVAMVFQAYALYPHMTVEENLAFGLKLRRLPKLEIARRVRAVANTLGLDEFLQRKPRALSGGQRQRVAMGRAIVREPHAYLMDEPLSNLDAKLRVQMRAEISKLQRELGVTTIYVTHDQTEAMTMGDRVAVMRDGHLQQVDNPERLYLRPANQFVAGFIGSPAMNLVEARLLRDDDGLIVGFGNYRLRVDAGLAAERPALAAYVGEKVVLGIRPEDIEDAAFSREAPALSTLDTVIGLREALGSEVLVHFSVAATSTSGPDASEFIESMGEAGSIFVARVHPQTTAREGKPLTLVVNTKRLYFFDRGTGQAIYRDTEAHSAARPSREAAPQPAS
jgi:multiple sugar transport system ATP-binding protein